MRRLDFLQICDIFSVTDLLLRNEKDVRNETCRYRSDSDRKLKTVNNYLNKYPDLVRKKSPLVYSLTNHVTMTDCANILLAAGASPVMSLDEREASDLARIADAVVINFGTPDENSVRAMICAGRAANAAGVPVLLDPVGAGATPLRGEISAMLMKEIRFTAIRGNASEIAFLAGGRFSGRGVDASSAEELSQVKEFVKTLAKRTGAFTAASGPVDVVSDGEKTILVRNGHPIMTQITGSGCMSSAYAGAYLGAEHSLSAFAASVAAMGVCGEIAQKSLKTGEGTGTFRIRLTDAVSLLDESQMKEFANYDCE